MRITAEEFIRHPFTKKVVRKYTQRLIKFGCYTEDERDAVEQESMSKLIANWPKFDEAVGHHKSFVCAVVNHASVNMSRRTTDKCRDCRPVSLSSTVNDPDDGRLHRMSPLLLKRHLRSPTSSGRDSHQIIPITCHQVITTPTICPKVIQVTIILACHRIQ